MQPLLSAGVLQLGLGWGGPVVVVYGFIACFCLSTFLALSLAEISSPFVTAGGRACLCVASLAVAPRRLD